MPIIIAIQEAEIRRIVVRKQPRHIVHETLSQKNYHKNRAGRMAQGESPSGIKLTMVTLRYCSVKHSPNDIKLGIISIGILCG
jgi:hypothetical protein